MKSDTSITQHEQSKRLFLVIQGIVQGVGFRPFVYNLAKQLNLKGYVKNTSDGVIIEVEGKEVNEFVTGLKKEHPPLSVISRIDSHFLPIYGYTDFQITHSTDSGTFTLISPDVAMCEKCRQEIVTKDDRRYLYPFTNCTHCGPRYSITVSIPYDRAQTTMAPFVMCDKCRTEYNNPVDRRFHAQPVACHKCGPQVELKINNADTSFLRGNNTISKTISLLKQGKLVAIKGLGGFHIACNALSKKAVHTLRQRKRKSNKPFALMAKDMTTIKKYVHVNHHEEKLLKSHHGPIVLLRKKTDAHLPESISPQNNYLGCMLPYTPLHYLLFFYPQQSLKDGQSLEILVMTSGNSAEEPIIKDNDNALIHLSSFVDVFLFHNRDIFIRVDDSVIRSIDNATLFVRRARGYVPEPIRFHSSGPDLLAVGADLKNTLTFTKSDYAIVSQYIGDMEHYKTLTFFNEVHDHLKNLYRVNPVAVAFDMHPGYASTRWAKKQKLTHIPVQHHHAHIASVMAEQGITHHVIGVAFDGTGYGPDASIWGGEFLIANLRNFERFCHLDSLPLIGGEMAIKQPFRVAIAWMIKAFGSEAPQYCKLTGFLDKYGTQMIHNLIKLSYNHNLSPLCTSAGRLFDALSALLGICDFNSFEAEAAIALEAEIVETIKEDYEFSLIEATAKVVDFTQTLSDIILDIINHVPKGIIAAKFHNTVIRVIRTVVHSAQKKSGITDVVLSGGVFQNMYLLKNTVKMLQSDGFTVFYNTKVPANDGGISLGQAYIAQEILKQEVS